MGKFTNWTHFLILSSLLFVHEIVEEIKNKRYAILHAPKYIQYLIYTCMVVGMFLFGQFGERKFIYFQF